MKLSAKHILISLGAVFVMLGIVIGYTRDFLGPLRPFPQHRNPSENSLLNQTVDSQTLEGKIYLIHHLKDRKLEAGDYLTEGYVLKKVTCLPDPQPGASAPCPKDHLIISETNRAINIFPLTEKDMVVFAKDTDRFAIGKRYRFKVKKQSYMNSQGQQENSFELVEARTVDTTGPRRDTS